METETWDCTTKDTNYADLHGPSVRRSHALPHLYKYPCKQTSNEHFLDLFGLVWAKDAWGRVYLTFLVTWETCWLPAWAWALLRNGLENLCCCLAQWLELHTYHQDLLQRCVVCNPVVWDETGWICIHTTKTCCKYMDEFPCDELACTSLHVMTWLRLQMHAWINPKACFL